MRRFPLLLATVLTLIGCDDDGPQEPPPPEEGNKDASVSKDGSLDAKAPPLDASRDPVMPVPDAAPPVPVVEDASVVDANSFDSAVADAGSDSGADAGSDAGSEDASMCVAVAERCDQGMCCEGNACVTSSEAAFNICAKICSQDEECDSGCCSTLPGSGADKVCAPQLHCDDDTPDPLAPIMKYCITAKVYGHDSTYLGDASYSSFGDSVCNKFGDYGSSSGENSIFNPFSDWSSDIKSNTLTWAPKISCDSIGTPIAYISEYKGQNITRVIDPDNLCQVLQNSGFY